MAKVSSDGDLCIVFVLPEENKEAGEAMQKAFSITEQKRVNPRWLNINACLSLVKDTQTIFVCEDIHDPKLGKIRLAHSRIIGPMCIITCYERNIELPRFEHPVFIPTMVNLIICCTNLERDVRDEIHRKVQLMGGVISRNFTVGVTHLITGEVGSKKYYVAASEKLPIMLPAWVDECWERGQSEPVLARDPCFDHFKCPIFLGVLATVSQLEGTERQKVRELIEANGGKYCGQMKSGDTTHLVLHKPEGEKYIYGRKWKLNCVNVNWVYDSVEKKFCQDEVLYDIGHGTSEEKVHGHTPVKKASTPIHGHSNTTMENTVMNFSAVATGSKQFNSSDVTTVEDTYMTQSNGNEKISWNTTKVATLKEDTDGCLNELQMRQDAGQFLDGCKIVLMCFSGHALDCVRKVLNAGGGVRYNNLNNDVTHVVLGDMSQSLLRTLQDCGIRPHVVGVKWLVESRKQGKPAEESPFMLINYDKPAAWSSAEETKLDQIHVNVTDESQSKVNTYFGDETDVDEILIKYKIPDPVTASTTPAKPEPGLDEIIAKATAESEGTLDSQSLFKNLTFIVEGFPEAETIKLTSLIESSGGKAVTVASPNSITVVPVIGYDTSSMRNRKIVTDCWLLSCAEVSSLMPVRNHRVYIPVEYKPNSQPLTGCVFSLSHYKGHVKDTLIKIGQYLGARYEECLARCTNPKTGRLANTHLVCGLPEGKKYDGALRWKLPVVSADWLLDCAKNGQMVPEEKYAPREPEAEAPEIAADIAQDETDDAQSIVQNQEQNPQCVNPGTKSPDRCAINSINKGTSESTNLSQSVRNKTRTSLRELDITVTSSNNRPYQHVILTPDLKTPKLNINKYGIKAAAMAFNGASEIESKKAKIVCQDNGDSPSNFMQKDAFLSQMKIDFGARVPKHNNLPTKSLSQKVASLKLNLGPGKFDWETPPSSVKSKEAANETVHKQMDDMLAAARVSNIKSNAGNLPALLNDRSPISFDLNEHRRTGLKPPPEPTQIATVTWDDPTSRTEREKLHRELHQDSQADGNPVIEQENQPLTEEFTVNAEDKIINPKPRIMFSGLPTKDRGMYRKIVEDLNGTVSDSDDFDQSCTHLIIGMLSRNEKMLGAIASGIWVLKRSYLITCREAGEFVAEDDHVWRSNELTPGSRAANLADAAIRWRSTIQENKKSGSDKVLPFEGWRAIVHLSEQRQGSICRLLTAGGATVLPHRPPFTNVTDATHAFLEVNNSPKSFVDISSLVANDVHCLQMEYIGNYLLEMNPPSESAYLVPEAVRK